MLARIILLGVLSSILAILGSYRPGGKARRSAYGGASLGAFGVILGCSILAKATSWENVWERLLGLKQHRLGYASGERFKCGLRCPHMRRRGADWALKRKFGETRTRYVANSLRSARVRLFVLF